METDARDSGDGCRPGAREGQEKGRHVKGAKLPECTGQGKPPQRRSAAAAAPGRLLLILYMTIAHTRRRPDEVESARLFLYRQLISEDCHVQP